MNNGQKTIGIVGGGQLGRMLTLAALPLGFKVAVIDPGENCPAAQAGATQIKAPLYDEAAIQKLGEMADFVTVEIEHLKTAALQKLHDGGIAVNPKPQTIKLIQDKYLQKKYLEKHNIRVAPFCKIDNAAGARAALKQFGGKMLLKTRHGAYDGRGNALVSNERELEAALSKFKDSKLYAEQFIPFAKELAVMVARDQAGVIKAYPITETVHQRNICIETYTPAAVGQDVQKIANDAAVSAVKHLEGAGVFGVEMFLTKDGQVLINEIAPRVHNSGHYTMEPFVTSQFEQHIRAISGLPLDDTTMLVPAVVMVNILGERDGPTKVTGLHKALAIPGVSVHIYGKSPTKVDRKMGHITAVGATLEEAKLKARKARKVLQI